MTDKSNLAPGASAPAPSRVGVFGYRTFTVILVATSISSIGISMFDTAMSWLMTSLSPSPILVSAVQVATMAPMFLLTIPAGALADILDPRRLLIAAETFVVLVGVAFAAIVSLSLETPAMLLMTEFLLGAAGALAAPAWEMITPMLVPKVELDEAIAYNNAGYNVARALGPAVGGVAITAISIKLPFWVYCCTNLILLTALLWWREPPRAMDNLPAERFVSAVTTGVRYALNNRELGATIVRAVAFFFFASAYWALMPLVARHQLHGGAELYGLIMGVLGLGSVVGSVTLTTLKTRLGPDLLAALGTAGTMLALVLFAIARRPEVALAASFVAGASWIVVLATLFVSAQLALPDWVRGRGLAIFLTAYFGAMTFGSALWGGVAHLGGLPVAQAAAAAGAGLAALATWGFKLQAGPARDLAPSMHWKAPCFVQRLENDEGPILMMVEYRIDPADRAEFVALAREVGRERMRDGAYAWNIFEDPNEPGRFIETCLVRSLLELRYRAARETRADALIEERMSRFLKAPRRESYLIAPKREQHGWRRAAA